MYAILKCNNCKFTIENENSLGSFKLVADSNTYSSLDS